MARVDSKTFPSKLKMKDKRSARKIYDTSLYINFCILAVPEICKDNDVHREEDTLHDGSIPNGQASLRDPSESDVAFREPLLAKSDSLSVGSIVLLSAGRRDKPRHQGSFQRL